MNGIGDSNRRAARGPDDPHRTRRKVPDVARAYDVRDERVARRPRRRMWPKACSSDDVRATRAKVIHPHTSRVGKGDARSIMRPAANFELALSIWVREQCLRASTKRGYDLNSSRCLECDS